MDPLMKNVATRRSGHRRRRRSRVEISPKTMLFAVAIAAGAWVALRLLPVVLIVIAALFLVGTLGPGVEWLEGRGVKRPWGIALVFSTMFTLAVLIAALTVPALLAQLTTLAKQEPIIRDRAADVLSRSGLTAPLAESLRTVRYEALAHSATNTALANSARVAELVGGLVSAVFLALYMMIDRERLRGALFATIPRPHHVRLSRVLIKLETIVGGYIRGQVVTSALMAVFVFALLAACRVPNAIAIAVFAAIADVLPYIGVFLSVGPAVVAALAKGPAVAVMVLLAMLAYEELESRFLVPRIYGRALRLPSSIVLLALLAGGTLLGIIGALLALPVASAFRMLIEELRVDLPGEPEEDARVRARDERSEAEYERRADGVPAAKAAAIAVAIAERLDRPTCPSAQSIPPGGNPQPKSSIGCASSNDGSTEPA
jgi:predicted PurR-regulated permease PerM